ncbi:NAD(P)-binding protein [Eremomyces bilateralis CBS 781.70]|uniref:NAD(P)-binding protein n=1 Tax=Eremomyces bilateralis CBS 781.70 TaxID=1392243 RepID=A0A6G1G225_9PEZI|nr:NAD(P)-binding protein [Eremomyces bilateralis CBS 781.70]KAF1811976.1 NAD(P)-binding protein [Eremomyces bilateralis CBS 781.70]
MVDNRWVCVTAAETQIGFRIAETLLIHIDFCAKINRVVALTTHPDSDRVKFLGRCGAAVVPHRRRYEYEILRALQMGGCDTICLVPPANGERFHILLDIVSAAKLLGIPNICFISSVGCDVADPHWQPGLRLFFDMERYLLNTMRDPDSPLRYSPVVIRPGFYTDNVSAQFNAGQDTGQDNTATMFLPIDDHDRFAPMALTDLALLAAHILTGHGQHGFDDRHHGQLIICTGPVLVTGRELATAASAAFGIQIDFKSASHRVSRSNWARVSQGFHYDPNCLLELLTLVSEGKITFTSTIAFHDITGYKPHSPQDFFNAAAEAARRQHEPSPQPNLQLLN